MKWRPTWGTDNEAANMSEKLSRIRAKRAGNRSIIAKLMHEVEGLFKAEPINETRLKVLATSLDERLNLVKSFDERVIETCKVDEIEREIVESDEFNSRVMEMLRKIMETTTPIDQGISSMAGTTSGKNENPGSVQSTGPNIEVQPGNVDSENAQVSGSSISTGIQSSDVRSNNQAGNTQQSSFNSQIGIDTPQVTPGRSGTNFQLPNNSNFSGNANSANLAETLIQDHYWDFVTTVVRQIVYIFAFLLLVFFCGYPFHDSIIYLLFNDLVVFLNQFWLL